MSLRVRSQRRGGQIHDPNQTRSESWIVIVEPDADASLLVVVTADEVSQ
jgi:hypothetical protein